MKVSLGATQRIYIIFFITLIVFLFSIIFVIRPWFMEFWVGRTELVENRERLEDRLRPKTQTLLELKEEELSKQNQQLEEALPSKNKPPVYFYALERMGQTAGVRLSGLVFLGSKKKETVQEAGELKPVGFNLTVAGNLSQIFNFLSLLESSKPVFDVGKIKLDTSSAPSGSSLASVSVVTYYQPEIEQVGEIEEPIVKFSSSEEALFAKVEELRSWSFQMEGVAEIDELRVEVGKKDLFQ